MADRYFSESSVAGDRLALAGAEAHHLTRVMRARPGTLVTVFDGSGSEFAAEIESIGRDAVQLRVCERRVVDRERKRRITIAAALPKGERQKWMIEKLVELGAACFIPLSTARSVAEPGEAARARLQRVVVEASKQCGRNRLMAIGEALPVESFVKLSGGAEGAAAPCDWPSVGELRLIAQPGGIPLEQILWRPTTRDPGRTGPADAAPTSATALIGPEGGFTDGESQAARAAGWQAFSLGPTILRIETAALAAAAILATWDGPPSD